MQEFCYPICIWEIQCGEKAGRAIPEFTRRISYSSEDLDADGMKMGGQGSRFDTKRAAAITYAYRMQDEPAINWVRMEWVRTQP